MSKGFEEYKGIFQEYLQYIIKRRSFWLAPVVFVLLVLGSLAFILEGSVVAPFIYAIF